MKTIDEDSIVLVAKRLQPLGMKCAFTGGAIIGLLLDHPKLTPPRTTKDVDVIIEVMTRIAYTNFEEKLSGQGFRHDMSEDAPRCRWIVDGVKVDLMPVDDPTGEWHVKWFNLALMTAIPRIIKDLTVHVVTAHCLIATKLEAFIDRGQGDFMGSHDMEDIITVVDGRAALADEIRTAPTELRQYVAGKIQSYLRTPAFIDSLPGHLAYDAMGQQRLTLLRQRLETIARMDFNEN